MTVDAPDWLSDDAREVWDHLAAAGVEGDRDALVVYCCAVADYRGAQRNLDQYGTVIRGARGGLVRSPLNTIKAENAAIIRRLGVELGLFNRGDDDGEPARDVPRGGWRNSAAVERTITALRRGGRLEDVDAAATALARHIARALDDVDAATNPAQTASLARVQLATLRTLRGVETEGDSAGSLDDLLAALSSPVVDRPQS